MPIGIQWWIAMFFHFYYNSHCVTQQDQNSLWLHFEALSGWSLASSALLVERWWGQLFLTAYSSDLFFLCFLPSYGFTGREEKKGTLTLSDNILEPVSLSRSWKPAWNNQQGYRSSHALSFTNDWKWLSPDQGISGFDSGNELWFNLYFETDYPKLTSSSYQGFQGNRGMFYMRLGSWL